MTQVFPQKGLNVLLFLIYFTIFYCRISIRDSFFETSREHKCWNELGRCHSIKGKCYGIIITTSHFSSRDVEISVLEIKDPGFSQDENLKRRQLSEIFLTFTYDVGRESHRYIHKLGYELGSGLVPETQDVLRIESFLQRKQHGGRRSRSISNPRRGKTEWIFGCSHEEKRTSLATMKSF
eukprot:jgi/Bigna1/127111/aug1.3_g1819